MTLLTEYKSLKITKNGAVANLHFAQPEKANAMTRDFWREFPLALDEIKNDLSLRVLVISGEGKHFSSGMDLSLFANNQSLDNSNPRQRDRLRLLVLQLQDVFSALSALRIPVIAAVHGACIGGALDLISACDMRYASKSAYFCLQEINLAMMADLGVLQRLPHLIPDGIVRELAFTGDKLSAERAQEIGLLNALFDDEETLQKEVASIAAKIAAKSPLAIAASKEALNYVKDHNTADSLAHAAVLQSSLFDLSDIAAAAAAAAKKSEADYSSLLKLDEI
ncbi:MAG: enoyl-CoA hydratase/isomerase family protein [Candidatus Obscuribacterales bacterium]|nr:enoyl-CoA hydratase/isomerase family protein [Candidatus Obscuribacterales bacterium]